MESKIPGATPGVPAEPLLPGVRSASAPPPCALQRCPSRRLPCQGVTSSGPGARCFLPRLLPPRRNALAALRAWPRAALPWRVARRSSPHGTRCVFSQCRDNITNLKTGRNEPLSLTGPRSGRGRGSLWVGAAPAALPIAMDRCRCGGVGLMVGLGLRGLFQP